MAKSNASQVVEWVGLGLLAVYFGPSILKRLNAANAKSLASTSPSAAASQQAAGAINAAGGALTNALKSLLSGQSAQQAKSGGSAPGLGSSVVPKSSSKDSIANQTFQIDSANLKYPEKIPQTWDQKEPGDLTSYMPVTATGLPSDTSAIEAIIGGGSYAMPLLDPQKLQETWAQQEPAEMAAPDASSVGELDNSAINRILGIEPSSDVSFDPGYVGESDSTYNYDDGSSYGDSYANYDWGDFGSYGWDDSGSTSDMLTDQWNWY